MEPIIYARDGIFIAQLSYDERQIAVDAGFRWDGENKSWHTTDITKA